jgi:hypothetical protein
MARPTLGSVPLRVATRARFRGTTALSSAPEFQDQSPAVQALLPEAAHTGIAGNLIAKSRGDMSGDQTLVSSQVESLTYLWSDKICQTTVSRL